MTPRQEETLKRFANDPVTSEAVYTLLRNFFLKRRKTEDVQMLAAEKLSFHLLEDAWKTVEQYGQEEKETEEVKNVGL